MGYNLEMTEIEPDYSLERFRGYKHIPKLKVNAYIIGPLAVHKTLTTVTWRNELWFADKGWTVSDIDLKREIADFLGLQKDAFAFARWARDWMAEEQFTFRSLVEMQYTDPERRWHLCWLLQWKVSEFKGRLC